MYTISVGPCVSGPGSQVAEISGSGIPGDEGCIAGLLFFRFVVLLVVSLFGCMYADGMAMKSTSCGWLPLCMLIPYYLITISCAEENSAGAFYICLGIRLIINKLTDVLRLNFGCSNFAGCHRLDFRCYLCTRLPRNLLCMKIRRIRSGLAEVLPSGQLRWMWLSRGVPVSPLRA